MTKPASSQSDCHSELLVTCVYHYTGLTVSGFPRRGSYSGGSSCGVIVLQVAAPYSSTLFTLSRFRLVWLIRLGGGAGCKGEGYSTLLGIEARIDRRSSPVTQLLALRGSWYGEYIGASCVVDMGVWEVAVVGVGGTPV